jgi:hypothetical protein
MGAKARREEDRQGGDAVDVPGQAVLVVVSEVGDQPQPGMHGQGGCGGQLGCLHDGFRSRCLTMKVIVDLALAPFILSC